MSDMRTAGQLRRENLERLVKEAGTLDAVATKGETTSVYLSQIRNQTPDKASGKPREMGPSMARRLERAFGKPAGWMDALPEAPASEKQSLLPPPPSPGRFDDRHEVSESDFGLLQAVHMILTDEEKASLRKRADHALQMALERIGDFGGRKS